MVIETQVVLGDIFHHVSIENYPMFWDPWTKSIWYKRPKHDNIYILF